MCSYVRSDVKHCGAWFGMLMDEFLNMAFPSVSLSEDIFDDIIDGV